MRLDSVSCVITQACHAVYRSRSDVFPRPSILPNQPHGAPHPRARLSTSFLMRYPNGAASRLVFCLSVSIDVAEKDGARVVGGGGD
jgi:hypothetical protein